MRVSNVLTILLAVSSLAAQSASVTRYGHGCQWNTNQCLEKNTAYSTDTKQPPTDKLIFVRVTAAANMQLSGFEILLRSLNGGGVRIPTALYSADAANKPAQLLRQGQDVWVDGVQRWIPIYMTPIGIASGTVFYLAFANPAATPVSLGATANTSGAQANWFHRPLAGGALTGPLQERWKYRILCDGRTPNIRVPSPPRLGSVISVNVDDVPGNAFAQLWLGPSNTSFYGRLLPLDLTFLGMPQCDLLASLDLHVNGTGSGSVRDISLRIPNILVLAGAHVYAQWLVSTPTGTKSSDAADLVFGY